MDTTTIEIKHDIAYSFLSNLERMHIIRIIGNEAKPELRREKLSERFAGCLSEKRVEELQKELTEMRGEMILR